MENEFFEQLKEEATVYGKAVGQVGKLRLIGIVSRVLGLFLLIFTVVLCVLAIFSFGAVAAIDAMANCMPVWAAALIIGSAYLVLIVLVIAFRRKLFVHPFIALMTKQMIRSQEELDIETLKANHEVEMQNVRFETRIENATRELNLYANLFTRLWSWISGKLRK
jgi:hypothetical protein